MVSTDLQPVIQNNSEWHNNTAVSPNTDEDSIWDLLFTANDTAEQFLMGTLEHSQIKLQTHNLALKPEQP